MFVNQNLQNHLETSSSVKNRSFISAEWNMNIPDNILMVGNYRYRKNENIYRFVPVNFIENDKAFENATTSYTLVDNGVDDKNDPIAFSKKNEKEKLYYSLEDCLGRFRPRSGINKVRVFSTQPSGNHFVNNSTNSNNLAASYLDTNRPRYYASDRNDVFKYWTSYRTENGSEYGVATERIGGSSEYRITDAAPFVVYKEAVPANRVVVKMQTNVGTVTIGPYVDEETQATLNDPFYGASNQTTPVKWRIQGLVNGNWEDLKSFDSSSRRRDGSAIIKADGYVELSYGLIVPDQYRNIFIKAETYSTEALLPAKAINGYAYLIKESAYDIGQYHIWIDEKQEYDIFTPVYGWDLAEETVDRFTHFVTDTTAPDVFVDTTNAFRQTYRELQYISGIRIVVDTMNKFDCTFDLIEMSSRLAVNITEKTKSVSVKKAASDLGVSGLPVGQLLVSTGNIDIFDYDDSFNKNNPASIIAKYAANQIQFKIYDVIAEVLENGIYYDYFVPIKTMYGDGFPEISAESRSVSISLRDMFSYFESVTAPQILATNASLSYAISFLLDNIGFGNYVFKRTATEKEPLIPVFFVEPDATVAEILNELARATQTAMFFDEYNNFVMMSKNWMMPSETDRPVDITLYGSKDSAKNGVVRNEATKPKLANITKIASQNTDVYNDGKINFTTRYIDKSYSSLEQANKLDRDKNWTYKPSLLWEVSQSEAVKGQDSANSTSAIYSLTAIPLKTSLGINPPEVDSTGKLINNTIDFGDGSQWMGRYAGYFYANGEIIKYDAVEYEVPGQPGESKVWISSLDEYQYYFSKIPFNGKMYPTGLVRIYAKPFYNKISGTPKTGKVESHGRGQFGTTITKHSAGLTDTEWGDKISGVTMDTDYLLSAIGNFQLKNAYIPYKTTIPVKTSVKNGGSAAWELTAPGVLSQSSGTGAKDVIASNMKAEEEYTYSLKMGGTKVFSVDRAIVTKKNVDTKTTLGDINITAINSGASTSSVTISIELPTFKSFFLNDTEAKKGQAAKFSWSVMVTGISEPISGELSAYYDNKTKKYDINKTVYSTVGTPGDPVILPASISKTISSITNDENIDFTLVIGTTVVKTITIKTTENICGFIGKFTNSVLEVDNRTIVVEDTSSVKIGQKVTLVSNVKKLSTSQTSLVTENPFAGDNQNNLRVESIVDDTRFKIKHLKDTGTSFNGISAKNTTYNISAINFEDTRFLAIDPNLKAGTKTSTSGNKDSSTLAKGVSITGVIKNFLSSENVTNSVGVNKSANVPTGSVQASALVMSGPSFNDVNDPESIDFISYTYKDLSKDQANYKYFGTRVRIVGRYEYGQDQSGIGEDTWYSSTKTSASGNITKNSVKASSGGIAVLLNPETNNGYYFEIAALSDISDAKTVTKYSTDGEPLEEPIHNLLFYKMNVGVSEDSLPLTNQKATPVKLWGGFANVTIDPGTMAGLERLTGKDAGSNSVYDLAVEYEIVNEKSLKFYLYVNNILVGTVVDTEPFYDPSTNKPYINKNMALFVRGKSKCMFEHVFAIASNPSQNSGLSGDETGSTNQKPLVGLVSKSSLSESGVFGSGEISFDESMRKYALSGILSESYLKDVSAGGPSGKSIYYEEFGTIMREAAYFNVRYDKSYPALTAKIAPTYKNNRGYIVSGFIAGPYSAEFLVFNTTDFILYLDGTDGNYLRILGVTFTQQSTNELTLDEYFSMRSNLSDPQTPTGQSLVTSPLKEVEEYNRIKNSRSAYGRKEFTLESRYIQSLDAATSTMEWVTSKIMKPRKSIGVGVFSLPTLQLGDIVNIDMKNENGIDMVAPDTSRFVVYQIDYNKSSDGPEMNVYLSEVV